MNDNKVKWSVSHVNGDVQSDVFESYGGTTGRLFYRSSEHAVEIDGMSLKNAVLKLRSLYDAVAVYESKRYVNIVCKGRRP